MFIFSLSLLLIASSASLQAMEDEQQKKLLTEIDTVDLAKTLLQRLQLTANQQETTKPIAASARISPKPTPSYPVAIPTRTRPYHSEFPGAHYQAPSPVPQHSHSYNNDFPSMHASTNYTPHPHSYPSYPTTSDSSSKDAQKNDTSSDEEMDTTKN